MLKKHLNIIIFVFLTSYNFLYSADFCTVRRDAIDGSILAYWVENRFDPFNSPTMMIVKKKSGELVVNSWGYAELSKGQFFASSVIQPRDYSKDFIEMRLTRAIWEFELKEQTGK